MIAKKVLSIGLTSAFIFSGSAIANADAAKPGQSMTHMKTAAGVLSTLEAAGVVVYVQGGATSSIIGDSISSANGQIVFRIFIFFPIPANVA